MTDEFTSSGEVHGETDHIKSTDKSVTVNAPVGQWVDVRSGQRTAEGTYVDDAGTLRDADDHSIVAWHFKPRHCTKKMDDPSVVVPHPRTGAPWCPDCLPAELLWEKLERKKQRRQFAGKRKRRKEILRRKAQEQAPPEPEYDSIVIREADMPELFDAVHQAVHNPLFNQERDENQ